MPKAITVTLNPAIDRILTIPGFRCGTVSSATDSLSFPAGKGVNAARALDALGKESVAIGIIGRTDQDFFDTIADGRLSTDWILTSAPTRTNLTICDPENGEETHIRMPGRNSGPFPLEETESRLREHCRKGDLVIFSGSIPENAPVDILSRLGRLCRQLGTRVLIDSSGKALRNALACAPDLIKPNLEELQELTGQRLMTRGEIIAAARTVARQYRIGTVIVSLGKDGSIAYDRLKEQAWSAELILPETLPFAGQALHAVGCGDAMVGGIASALLSSGDIASALVSGTAAGASNLFTEGPGIIPAEIFRTLSPLVSISPAEIR